MFGGRKNCEVLIQLAKKLKNPGDKADTPERQQVKKQLDAVFRHKASHQNIVAIKIDIL